MKAIKAAMSCCQRPVGTARRCVEDPPQRLDTGAVGRGLNPKVGQAAAYRQNVVKQLENSVASSLAVQGPHSRAQIFRLGELRPPDGYLGRRWGVHEGCENVTRRRGHQAFFNIYVLLYNF